MPAFLSGGSDVLLGGGVLWRIVMDVGVAGRDDLRVDGSGRVGDVRDDERILDEGVARRVEKGEGWLLRELGRYTRRRGTSEDQTNRQ